ncbi:MAG: hypothetical protein A3G34_00140 [Candidatus Lindowbacteria bacterium RIFCSPLOWO2_12_FULL_62_27]|nr:MAG: hypothetical protein A3G34_00140 [Candidatus Lindowbacteria bacterium RIFCSPLOWO2_12_FULL_62_27]OGH56694.1 MAG: hypothetical protein A3I06_07580 [Candidatus Lindowbacteria bacterium RIFCSPLOWO2_02_FULL_62_12]
MTDLRDDDHCFVCGRANPIGLKLSFDVDLTTRQISAVFRPDRRFQGWKNRLHGGILSAIMDESMVNVAYLLDMPAVTGEMTIRYREPVDTDQPLTITGRLIEVRSKFIRAESACRTATGARVADATALLIRLS